jgi:Na+/H+ antiporter NhaC
VHLSPNSWAIIRSVYGTIHAALWALLISGAVWLLLHIPQMRDARARAEAQRLQEVSEENKLYCEKWGMPARSHEHLICTMD